MPPNTCIRFYDELGTHILTLVCAPTWTGSDELVEWATPNGTLLQVVPMYALRHLIARLSALIEPLDPSDILRDVSDGRKTSIVEPPPLPPGA